MSSYKLSGKAILEHILSDCTPDERVAFIHNKMEQLATDLKAGRIPLSDLAITKQLTKSPNDYADKKSLPHVQVAVRVNSKSGGKKLKSGDTIEYVICDDGSNLPATQRAYHVDEIKVSMLIECAGTFSSVLKQFEFFVRNVKS